MAEQSLSIIGLGLIGGSIGLAVRKTLNHFKITGYDQSDEVIHRAESMGAIHLAAPSLEAALASADWVILCVPPGETLPIFRTLAGAGTSRTIVTDVTSTKRSIVMQAEQFASPNFEFVGSHPIAGSEKAGVASATPDLFYDALCVLTPTPKTSSAVLQQVTSFWQSLGMQTREMSCEDHDRAFAAVSHLPHAVAAALMNGTPPSLASLAGKGFRDTTRIAAGSPALWRDILTDNSDFVRDGLLRLSDELRSVADLLSPDRSDELLSYLTRAADARRSLTDRSAGSSK